MFKSLLISIVTLCGFVSAAYAEEPTIINDKKTVYRILSNAPRLEAQILRTGLAFRFSPVVTQIELTLEENSQDPDYIHCEATYRATIAEVTDSGIKEPPFLAGMKKPSVTKDHVGPCAFFDVDFD